MTKMTVQEWSSEKRKEMGERILAECDVAAQALGAKGVVIVALFEVPEEGGGVHVHCLDGGRAPWSLLEVYERMVKAHKLTKAGLEGSVQ